MKKLNDKCPELNKDYTCKVEGGFCFTDRDYQFCPIYSKFIREQRNKYDLEEKK